MTTTNRTNLESGVRQIGLRLYPDELAKVQEIARTEQRSLASFCRMAVLRTLSDYQKAQLGADHA